MKSNRQITKYFLVLTSVSMLATSAVAQSLSDADLKSRLDYALRTRQTKDGKSFGFPSSSEVLNATKGKSGKFTIDTGDKEENVRFQNAKASGGVIVGSGADGLVAQSNLSANGDIVVIPPVEMNMSVTVVGGTGSYCVTQAPIGSRPALIKSFSRENCRDRGEVMRILKAGRYLLTLLDGSPWVYSVFRDYFDRPFDSTEGNLGTFIEVAPDEHKIVPLRKITVPSVANHTVEHHLQQNIGNEYYQKQLEQVAIGLNPGYKIVSEFEFRRWSDTSLDLRVKVDFPQKPTEEITHIVSVSSPGFSGKSGAHIYYVLPGVYKINWTIDGQSAPSTDVYVE